jgi:hypothetical protein
MRCYHRATRIAVDLTKSSIGSAEFFAECARIAQLTKISGLPKPGTLGLLINDYRASTFFLDLAPRTRADYQRCLDYLKPIAETALVRFDRALVVRIRDKAATKHGRRFANYVKAVLSIIFAWGAERGYIASNPADKVKNIRREKGAPEANRPWSDAERETVLTHAPAHMRSAIGLMMFTGWDPRMPYDCRAHSITQERLLPAVRRRGSQSFGKHPRRSRKFSLWRARTTPSRSAPIQAGIHGPRAVFALPGASYASNWSTKKRSVPASPFTGSDTPSR